jgi:hypothetical protein
MKVIRHFLFLFVLVSGTAVAVSAQRQDDPKKPPPKGRPPVINPSPKNPPPDSNKPKRPGYSLVIFKSPETSDIA